MALTARRQETYGEMGPAMRALPNARWRSFVEFYLMLPPSRTGAFSNQAEAARRAGFGTARTSNTNIARIGYRLVQDERIQAAIAEEARKLLRGGGFEAVKQLLSIVSNPEHKDQCKAIGMVLARTDPEVTRHDMNIVHRHIDPEQEELEELRALRELGTSREKMLQIFGGNRLPVLEAREAEQRARSAKVIEGEVVDVDERASA
jgi:hypothetical protein